MIYNIHVTHNNQNEDHYRSIPVVDIDQSPLVGKLSDFGPVSLKLVRHTELEPLYNSLVHYYHYLGYQQIVGAHLKYMAFINERPVACLGWGSAAWRVKSRDDFIGWDKQTKDEHLHFVANNTRFLILSWVSILNALPLRSLRLMPEGSVRTGLIYTTILYTCLRRS